jgi:hypothetical protein
MSESAAIMDANSQQLPSSPPLTDPSPNTPTDGAVSPSITNTVNISAGMSATYRLNKSISY